MFKNSSKISGPEKVIRYTLLGTGLGLLGASMFVTVETALAFQSAEEAIKEICGHMSGALGALLMAASGVGAVVSAAMGNIRASMSFLVVGVGSFATSSIMSLSFPEASKKCEEGAQETGTQGNGPQDPGGTDGTDDAEDA